MRKNNKPFYAFFKRAFDIMGALLAIIVFSWLMLIIAVAIKIDSKGPIIFKDKRIGKNGKEIKVYKFRSMYVDCETNIEKYLTEEQLALWNKERKVDNDVRITRVGKFIRKTSLDELPQLFNILSGKMSFVGNRPITKKELEIWYSSEEQKLLETIKPGLTGYWQVCGRSDITFTNGERQNLDLQYINNQSFSLDTKIFFKTFYVVLKRKGAR